MKNTEILSIIEINKKEILTVKETALLLGCSGKTVYRLIHKGIIKANNLSERMIRIKRSDLNKILN